MAEEQRVAVGRALDEGARADQAGAAGAVVDHDLLAERARKLLGDDARQRVDAAAGRIGNDEGDGPGRIVLGSCGPANADNGRGEGRGHQQLTQHLLPVFLEDERTSLDPR